MAFSVPPSAGPELDGIGPREPASRPWRKISGFCWRKFAIPYSIPRLTDVPSPVCDSACAFATASPVRTTNHRVTCLKQ
jgi:hypothetical protein